MSKEIVFDNYAKPVSFYVGNLSPHDQALISSVLRHDEYGLLNMTPPKPLVVLDIGAHAGSFAVMVKTLWPDAIVHCFEPNPCILPVLRENAKRYDGITVHPYAISDSKFNGWISVPNGELGPDIGASTIVGEDKTNLEGRNAYRIEALSVNEAMNMTGEKFFGLVKWDCEGAEWPAFAVMSESNRTKIRYMVGEWHNGTGVDFLKMASSNFTDFSFSAITDIEAGQGRFEGVRKAWSNH